VHIDPESIVLPAGVAEAAAHAYGREPDLFPILFDHVIDVVGGLTTLGPGTAVVVHAKTVFERFGALLASPRGVRERASRRTPAYAAVLASWATDTLAPAFAAPGAPARTLDAVGVDDARAAFEGAVVPDGVVGEVEDFPSCTDLLSAAAPDAATASRVIAAFVADPAVEAALEACGADGVVGTFDTLSAAFGAPEPAVDVLAAYLAELQEQVQIAADLAWYESHLLAFGAAESTVVGSGHRARGLVSARDAVQSALGAGVVGSCEALVACLEAIFADVFGGRTVHGGRLRPRRRA
jgi:hypothetical protein